MRFFAFSRPTIGWLRLFFEKKSADACVPDVGVTKFLCIFAETIPNVVRSKKIIDLCTKHPIKCAI